jgi:N-acetylglucosaminyldiphosphoundecaprenol N-acetyl-beta-D-mannosaminyltransferase
MDKLSLLGVTVNAGTAGEFVDKITSNAIDKKGKYVCVANVHMLVEAYNDSSFARVINNANVITPDGMPLTWAIRWLYNIKQDRVAGMDLLPELLNKASILKLPVFFYGGTRTMLAQTKEYLKKHFPEVKLAGTYDPPFTTRLTQSEEDKVVDIINNSGAALVFVVLGCPKQEKWMASMVERINAVMIGIGGALPVMIKMQKRAPVWMQHLGLEWLFRLYQEPKRLFKRYAVTNSKFIYLIIKEVYNRRKSQGRFNGRKQAV